MYRKDGKKVEEKAGSQYKNAMTPAKASLIRAAKITGKLLPNNDQRAQVRERVTLTFLFDEFVSNKQEMKSIQCDISRYKKHIRGVLGKKAVTEIRPLDVYKLKKELSKKYKPQTVKHVLVLIRRIINFGSSLQLCPRFDFKIEMPKFDNKKTEDMTDERYKTFLMVLNDYKKEHPDPANIMRIALFTGMRRGEIFGLQSRDVDFERGFIHIRNGKGIITESIPMNKLTRNVLKSVSRDRGSEYIFPNSTGGRLNSGTYTKHFKRIRELAGLPKDFRPMHGLRHTFASSLISSGEVDLYTLQRLLTHKSPEMTQRYAHLRDKTLKRASGITDTLVKKIMGNEDLYYNAS